MKPFIATPAQIAQFSRDGYLMVPGLFDSQEMDLLLNIGRAELDKTKHAHAAKDAEGMLSKLWLDGGVHDDIYGAIVRCLRVRDNMERFMGGEIYHYHHKMMVKEPRVGGAWEWHQDYGYWYHNGCLRPDMSSCMIAVDRAYKGNGCLQVIKGSHLLGRIEHGTSGTQVGANIDRVNLALKHQELVYAEMEPGTALFFHANLLHRSDQNRSENPRWTLICCYNRADNPCEDRPGHPNYRRLDPGTDEDVANLGRRQWEQIQAQPATV